MKKEMAASLSASIKDNINGILAIIISFALFPALLSGIEQAKRYMTGASQSLVVLLDIVPFLFVAGVVIGAIYHFIK
jgi:hypothetical protein